MNDDLLRVIGECAIDPEDVQSINSFGHVSLEFKKDGFLVYTIHGEEKDQKIFMTFELAGGFIITDQPSKPSKERSPYHFTNDDRLVVLFGSESCRFIRKSHKVVQ